MALCLGAQGAAESRFICRVSQSQANGHQYLTDVYVPRYLPTLFTIVILHAMSAA